MSALPEGCMHEHFDALSVVGGFPDDHWTEKGQCRDCGRFLELVTFASGATNDRALTVAEVSILTLNARASV